MPRVGFSFPAMSVQEGFNWSRATRMLIPSEVPWRAAPSTALSASTISGRDTTGRSNSTTRGVANRRSTWIMMSTGCPWWLSSDADADTWTSCRDFERLLDSIVRSDQGTLDAWGSAPTILAGRAGLAATPERTLTRDGLARFSITSRRRLPRGCSPPKNRNVPCQAEQDPQHQRQMPAQSLE